MTSDRASDEPAIRTAGIEKRYGKVLAVSGLDLRVRRGEIYGFLGRNGAGKTTTIRMLLGLIRPTKGEIALFGQPVRQGSVEPLKKVGFLVETATAYPNLTVRENLEIQRRLSGARRAAVEEVIELLALSEYAQRTSRRLSLGNRQRLALARALVHSPELLILDEPANGLDPAGIVEIRGLLRRLAETRGVTIFMSSHLLSEVDQLADRVGIIHAGQLVEELERGQIEGRRRLYIELEVDQAARAEGLLRERLGLTEIAHEGAAALRIKDGTARPEEIARLLVEAGIALKRLLPVEENLERHFMRLTGGEP